MVRAPSDRLSAALFDATDGQTSVSAAAFRYLRK